MTSYNDIVVRRPTYFSMNGGKEAPRVSNKILYRVFIIKDLSEHPPPWEGRDISNITQNDNGYFIYILFVYIKKNNLLCGS